ncbi:hypothetical protein CspeluHIS016_0802060 [Cutaneotrichosporon spelunceum]|uniref:Uncharacterized protein n=1 Tax=Cutaneotrichosporon spelunceum TaxID=1672016 RepID=A0AAD3YDU9_9TREE|nr:hypothetical protein CspeluHIS016_0802060 [Cutaneotrichosporon spelunceum]
MAAIYTVFTSPHHAPMPNHLPTLIVTPHGQPNHVLYTYLHTEENRVNYLLTPSPDGDLCVAKLHPPPRAGATSNSSLPTMSSQRNNVVHCEASRDLKWTIENTGRMNPTYKVVNQDDTPLYQISKPNPHAEHWTMFYFKYAGHQIPPRRVEFGKIQKNPQDRGGGTRITITGKTDDEKQVWQTLGVGNEDCVEWVVACACLNLLDDQILQAAERKQTGAGPASTAPSPAMRTSPVARGPGPAATRGFPPGGAPPQNGRMGPGIASTGPGIASTAPPAGYRGPPPQMQGRPPMGNPGHPGHPGHPQQPPPPQGYNPHMRGPPGANPAQRGMPPMQPPPPQAAGRRL